MKQHSEESRPEKLNEESRPEKLNEESRPEKLSVRVEIRIPILPYLKNTVPV
jgi:hypothetical protein